ncbi:adenosylcobinamide amidohydrolase [Natrinema caseinilyticum]|uniref:adenosylcobinamide amidohydrolase n=1 Tax=Natrinema caseinilyticum TaxID=2961570 RepID=UPI0020C1BC91|nr:adenosylcobinamide amidohydrolase [Natrinema caseinilyticum]
MNEHGPAYAATRRADVLRVSRPETEWLSTGWNGGRRVADHAYNVSVPDGWDRTDLGTYVDERLERAGFGPTGAEETGPALLTGVDISDARGARRGPVTAYATAGVSNPAALPMVSESTAASDANSTSDASVLDAGESGLERERERRPGTVNVIVGTTRALAPGALANLVAVAAEAKAATLLAETGFPGTTTDAVVVGHDPSGPPAEFSGSGTEVGAATRACVREAVRASLCVHYTESDVSLPDSVADAAYGVSTDVRAAVFRPRVADDAAEHEK